VSFSRLTRGFFIALHPLSKINPLIRLLVADIFPGLLICYRCIQNGLVRVGDMYQIKVKGHLDSSWSQWLNDLSITHEEDGVTRLVGPLADQAALHGLLIKIRDLGLPLLSVNCISADQEEDSEQPV
jgi:hypothetical protein